MGTKGKRGVPLNGILRGLAVVALVATAGGTVTARAPDAGTPSAEDFGALPFLAGPVLSPDGQRIISRSVRDGRTRLVLTDLSGEQQHNDLIDLGPRQQLEWYRWVGSDTVLVSVSFKTVFMAEEVRATRVIAYTVSTKALRALGPKEQGIDGDDVIYVDPAGQFVLLSTQPSIYDYPSVLRIDIATGKSRRIVAPHDYVWDWYADTNGTVRAGVGRLDGKWWVYYRKDETADFTKTIRRTRGAGDGQIDNMVTTPGSDQGYAMASGSSGRFGLYRYDFAADKLGELIYENPVVDVDDFDLDDRGGIESISFTDDRSRIEWRDPELKTVQEQIEKATPGLSVRITSRSANRMRLIVWVGSARNPGTYYVYDRNDGVMRLFARPYAQLRGKRLSDMASVSYKARDGLDIPAYLTLPPGREAHGLPLVMMPHGGPFARDSWGYDVWAQFLASRGYVVLQPNFRGSTGYGRAFVEKGTGQWGRGMQDDIDDGVRYLVTRGIVDPKRVCIMGASFGGYAAEWAAVRNPDIYRCAISFAGVSDVAAMLRYDRKSFSAPRYFRDWRARVEGKDGASLDSISPALHADKLTIPLMLAHGDDDDNVPISQSKKLADALTKAGRPPEFYVYKGEKHGFSKPEDQVDFLKHVEAFLTRYNPA